MQWESSLIKECRRGMWHQDRHLPQQREGAGNLPGKASWGRKLLLSHEA